ncbi:hypothetical protein PAHAL_5G301300 [Panicum hallii]|uniref:Uncharacterized protein n=1 Tax=Panicum hallii TaxID=206008 RepID=A0A2S3HUW8_9POAL|nr:uncharacterized protein LOC112893343 [Panicum hallii]PAN30353.1 hypothetical protein PAHAL_5G301300 [Panicum hallii]
MLQQPDSDSMICYFALGNFIVLVAEHGRTQGPASATLGACPGSGMVTAKRHAEHARIKLLKSAARAPAAEGTQQRTNRGAPVIDPTIPRRPGYQIDDANRERGRASNAPRTPRPWAINYATARVGVRQVQRMGRGAVGLMQSV